MINETISKTTTNIVMGFTMSLFISLCLLTTGVSHAAVEVEASDETKAQIAALREKIKGRFRSEPSSIKLSQLPNMLEAIYGTEVVYFSTDGKYFFVGDIVELETKTNLSKIATQSVRKNIMDKQDLKPVVFKAKNEKHKLTVFTDIDCGYCAKLHREMAQMNANGITVEYMMFPRAGLQSKSFEKAVSMWCADDQQQAMTDAKQRLEIAEKSCDNPIAAQYELGKEVGVTGTPALVTSTGQLIPGYVTADNLLVILDEEANL